MQPLEPPDFTSLVDLAAERVGGKAILATDEFFAAKENLLKPGRGVFIPDKYTDCGKWMDGWESRRRRGPGHDSCVIRLGLAGRIRGVDIDTNHFLGNFPEFASVDACVADPLIAVEELAPSVWTQILPMERLEGGIRNLFAISNDTRWTHVRLNIYPDGGVARFRAHGEVEPDWAMIAAGGVPVDLAAVQHGGVAILASDMFFSHMNNLLMPGRSPHMGDGWETRRRRGAGHDWIVVRLGHPGEILKIEVDTNHFKGNFPESCLVEALNFRAHEVPSTYFSSLAVPWQELLPKTKLKADNRHFFEIELKKLGVVSHIRLNIFPDGGVSRLRVHGRPYFEDQRAFFATGTLQWLNNLEGSQAQSEFMRCCHSSRWAQKMNAARPFLDTAQLHRVAQSIWDGLEKSDYLEAIGGHPRIGGVDPQARKDSQGAWAGEEQAGATAGSPESRAAMAARNKDYETRFGHIFVVCATGRTSDEMLALIEARLENDPELELQITKQEQAKITALRLEKLLANQY